MKMKKVLVVAATMVVLMSPNAWAARTAVHVAAESPDYGTKLGGMIGRGAINVLTSFVDVLVNIVNDTKAGPPLVGTLTGLSKGVGCGVLRLGSGAVDLTTFWVPGFNGFPVSDSYDNCLAVSSGHAEGPAKADVAAAQQPAATEPEASALGQPQAAQAATAPPRKSERQHYAK